MPAPRAHPRRVRHTLILASLFLIPAAAIAQISPPPGPVAPTMKRLDQLEPRTLITSLPGSQAALHVISQPGSYLLTADLLGQPDKHGIQITANGPVSIDLGGFTLRGVQGALNGIHADSSGGLRLSITGSGDTGSRRPPTVLLTWGTGLAFVNAASVSVSGLSIEGCTGHAIQCLEVKHIVHRDIAARNCAQGGILCTSPADAATGPSTAHFEDVTVSDCGGDGLRAEGRDGQYQVAITRASASGCAGHGVCVRTTTSGGGFVSRGGVVIVLDGRVSSNGLSGLHIDLADDSLATTRITGVTATSNTGDGIHIKRFGIGDTAPAAPLAYIGTCDASENGASGIVSANPLYVGSTHCGNNALHGLRVSQPSPLLLACNAESSTFKGNGAANAYVPRGRFSTTDCLFTDGQGDGITLDEGCLLLTNCSVTNNAGNGATVRGTLTVTSSNFRRNRAVGLSLSNGSCVAESMVCELNGGAGTGLPEGGAIFTDCTSITLDRCIFNDNTGDGVRCSSTVGPVRWMAPESIANRNTGSGFHLNDCDGAQLIRCSSIGNGAFGKVFGSAFRRGRIEGCSATGNGGGFLVEGTGNLFIGNSSTSDPLGAFSIAPGNITGPTIDAASIATDCNPRANVIY